MADLKSSELERHSTHCTYIAGYMGGTPTPNGLQSWSKVHTVVVGTVFCNITWQTFLQWNSQKSILAIKLNHPALPHSMLVTEKALFCCKCPECVNFISTDQHWVRGGGKLLIVPTLLSRIVALPSDMTCRCSVGHRSPTNAARVWFPAGYLIPAP